MSSSATPVAPTSPQRDSSLEALRLIAMLLVLLLHANFLALGFPTPQEVHASPLASLTQLWAEGLCIVAVNVFILLSGYFGIRLKGRSLLGLLFQSSFYTCLGYLLSLLITNPTASLEPKQLLYSLIPLSKEGGWFLPAYIGLMLLSPWLERTAQTTTQRELQRYLLLYYTIHTLWGFLFKTFDIKDGYSTFSFVGIYLIGLYLRRSKARWETIAGWKWIVGYFSLPLLSAFLFLCLSSWSGLPLHQGALPYLFMSYASPLVIASAVMLFLGFAQYKRYHSTIVNWAASSTLAVYLLHCSDYLFPTYLLRVQELHQAYPLWGFLPRLLLFIAGVFVASLLIDQIRKLLWIRLVLPLGEHWKKNKGSA